MPKGRLVLSVDDALIKKMKIKAIQDDTNVSNIVEKLIENYMSKEKLQNPIEFISEDTTNNK